jgi:mRNA interferase RelE/StbE
MAYDITYTGSAEQTFKRLETDEQSYIQQKLNQIASSEFRHPSQWDFKRLEGQAEGRFRIGNDLRVFADINDREKTIRVHGTERRENLYS